MATPERADRTRQSSGQLGHKRSAVTLEILHRSALGFCIDDDGSVHCDIKIRTAIRRKGVLFVMISIDFGLFKEVPSLPLLIAFKTSPHPRLFQKA